jgi:biotin synthase
MKSLPDKIRVSVGSAIILELTKGLIIEKPSTVYLLTYLSGNCSANCSFCPQAKGSKGRADLLSRVTWPIFLTEEVISKTAKAYGEERIRRVCVQALNYPTVFEEVLKLVTRIREDSEIPISLCCQPLNLETMEALRNAGVERICIPLDAATKEVFNRVKGRMVNGPYVWEKHLNTLKEALSVFGRGYVTTHLIVGLGEKDEEMLQMVQWCVDLGIHSSLFSFTPIQGTALEGREKTPLKHYRRIQIAHHLITGGEIRYEKIGFDKDGCILDFSISQNQLKKTIRTGIPFITSGCPGCNRPYYNERPSGPLYNYPRRPFSEEIKKIEKEIGIEK